MLLLLKISGCGQQVAATGGDAMSPRAWSTFYWSHAFSSYEVHWSTRWSTEISCFLLILCFFLQLGAVSRVIRQVTQATQAAQAPPTALPRAQQSRRQQLTCEIWTLNSTGDRSDGSCRPVTPMDMETSVASWLTESNHLNILRHLRISCRILYVKEYLTECRWIEIQITWDQVDSQGFAARIPKESTTERDFQGRKLLVLCRLCLVSFLRFLRQFQSFQRQAPDPKSMKLHVFRRCLRCLRPIRWPRWSSSLKGWSPCNQSF